MASTGEPPRAGHLPALDGVRGVAILLVVWSHAAAGHVLGYGGTVGVTLFFVLSGYLITRILGTEIAGRGRVALSRFYMRRARRLLPALVVCLLVTGLLLYALSSPLREDYPAQAAAALLYVGNFPTAFIAMDSMGILGHTWSLAVEEQFYLLWPLLLVLILRRWSLPAAARMVTWLAVAAVVWRLAAVTLFDFWRVYVMLDTNAFALLMGAALALRELAGLSRPATGRRAVALTGGGLAILLLLSAPPTLEPVWSAAMGYGAPAAALAGLALVNGARTSGPVLASPLMRWFGRVSYGWYLWHHVFLKLAGEDGARYGAAILALAVAVASWRYVEQPILRRRRAVTPVSAVAAADPA